jgi:signal transduction histidine kinase
MVMHDILVKSIVNMMVFGAVILAFVYHLVMYIYNKDRLYLHYIIFLFHTLLYFFYTSGFYKIIFGNDAELNFFWYYNEPIQMLYFASYFNFILQSIEVDKSESLLLKRAWKIMMLVIVGYAVGYMIWRLIVGVHTYVFSFNAIRVFIFMITLLTLWQCFKLRKITFQRYILWGSALYFFMGLISFVGNFYFESTWLIYPYEWLTLGTFLDVIFFSIAMSYRNQMQIEKFNQTLLDDANQIITMQKEVLEKQTALENERSRVASDMHDDLGSGLTKIKYLSDIPLQSEKVYENLPKIKSIASDLVENMSEIIWALKEENDTLENLLTYIKKYSAEYLEDNQIDVKINIPEEIPLLMVKGDIRRNIFLSVKEVLHNVVKHAEAHQVEIKISTENTLEIILQDDGKGFDIEKVTKGNGLKNLKKRWDKLDGNFEIISKEGTQVRFSILLHKLN